MVAAQGLDNAVPTRRDAADRTRARCGRTITPGRNGASTSRPRARRARRLRHAGGEAAARPLPTNGWRPATTSAQARIWREMLMNHAENQWIDRHGRGRAAADRRRGTACRTCRTKALYAWEPTARCSASTASTSSSGQGQPSNAAALAMIRYLLRRLADHGGTLLSSRRSSSSSSSCRRATS